MTAICWAPGGCSPMPVAGNLVVLTPGEITADFAAAGADHLLPVALPSGYAPEAKTAAVLAAIAALKPRHVLFPERPTGGGDIGRRVAAGLGEAPAVRVLRLSPEEAGSRGNGGGQRFPAPAPAHHPAGGGGGGSRLRRALGGASLCRPSIASSRRAASPMAAWPPPIPMPCR